MNFKIIPDIIFGYIAGFSLGFLSSKIYSDYNINYYFNAVNAYISIRNKKQELQKILDINKSIEYKIELYNEIIKQQKEILKLNQIPSNDQIYKIDELIKNIILLPDNKISDLKVNNNNISEINLERIRGGMGNIFFI